jgi:glycogen debranching enzyme
MDNSPAWDVPLARVPTDTVTPVRRRDTLLVDAAMRPRGEEYQRFIHLVDVFRDAGWDPARMLSASPFRVADVGTNAILLRAEKDLLAMAVRFGSAEDRAEIDARIARLSGALDRLWRDDIGLYASMDLVTHETCPVGTSAGFLPLYAGHGREHAATLVATLAGWAGAVARLVPSADPAFAGFEAKRYWRGPVWAVVNWMIADGFAAAHDPTTAARIQADTVALIEAAGLSEYFDPVTGEGIGGADFSWTAAIYLLWSGTESPVMAAH